MPLEDAPPASAPPAVPGIEDLVPIGRGGFSVVYRGYQSQLGRDVAVKVLSSALWDGADADRWRREITAMGRLSNHPNIVAAYAGGLTDDGRPYVVMPYLPEGSLGDRVRRSGPLPPAEVATLGAQLAGALASAHEAGVLHRDVKPDNVLLSPYGQPQLTDFGIARLLDATTTMTRTIHATVAYAPPEVLAGRPATEAADVYGLGATLFACLAGAPPFPSTEHDNVVSLVSRITTQRPPDLGALGVPEPLAAVISDSLAKTPAERIPTAAELQRRLEAAAAALDRARDRTPPMTPQVGDTLLAARDEGLTGLEPLPVRPEVGWVHRPVRRRAWAGLLAVAGGLALVGAVFLLTRDDGDGDPSSGEPQVTDPAAAAPTVPSAAAAPTSNGSSASVGTAAEQYFGAIAAGDLERSYSMLTPAFRAQQTQVSYERFWRSVAPVEVVGPVEVDASGQTAVVPITMAGHRQDYPLRLAPDPDGGWLVDGPRPGDG